MYEPDWTPVTGKAATELLKTINRNWSWDPFEVDSYDIDRAPLPFFEGLDIVRLVSTNSFPEQTIFVLIRPGQVSILDGSNAAIYEITRNAPSRLDRSNVADYVTLFFTLIGTPKISFSIVTTSADLPWRVEATVEDKRRVDAAAKPVTVIEGGSESPFLVAATMTCNRDLSAVILKVSLAGEIDFVSEQSLVEELAIIGNIMAH